MPLQTITESLTDSIPAWVMSVAVLGGGYLFNQSLQSSERLATLEAKSAVYVEDVREIKQAIIRLEDHLIGAE